MVRYGLLGKKLGHSFSPKYFNGKFGEEGIDARYDLFEIPEIDRLPELIKDNPDLKGLNVTIPYKECVIPYLDEISPEARRAGAVNVIKFSEEGDKVKLAGHNTDIIGFRESLRKLLDPNVSNKAIVLGTGGASKAVAVALEDLKIPFQPVSRHKAEGRISYEMLDKEMMDSISLVINTTPLGMFPEIDESLDIPYQFLNGRHLCYDLIYNPEETRFLCKARAQGARIKNGIEMLEIQAEEAWRIWNEEA